VKLDFHQVDLHLTHPWKLARTDRADVQSVTIVQLTDEHGITGMGEAAPVKRYGESIATTKSFYQKVDLTKLSFHQLEQSSRYVDTLSSADQSAKCGLNVALFDGAAKISGKSLCDYFNLGFQEKKHVTSFTIGIDEPAVIREKVMAAEKLPVLKMKVGVTQDKANLKALREVAPTKPVRVDANEGWSTREEALKMIEYLAQDPHIEFVEQPMPASAPVADWSWLKARSPLPIFGDESYHLAQDVERSIECFHGVNIKLVKTGGVSFAFEALQAARKAGLKTMIGCMIETSVLITAAAHLAELADYLDLDGNLLIKNDPYLGVTAENGVLSFTKTPVPSGLRVGKRPGE
jgi:L-Ala-D/L-Glu epimerase